MCLFVLVVFMHGLVLCLCLSVSVYVRCVHWACLVWACLCVGLVLCLCLSVSVYVCLCPLCALSLFGLGVFMCWSSLHMVANLVVLESATSTIMSGNSSHLGVCTTSLQSQQFQLFAPKLSQEFGIDLSKTVQFIRRMKSYKKTFNL